MTQEELQEVLRRYEAAPKLIAPSKKPAVNSEQTVARLEQVNNHFSWMTALNIASLSILTTVGVTMLLDTVKDKKD